MSVKKILVLDDEKNLTFIVKALLERAGYSVFAFNNPIEGLATLDRNDYCLVITDLYMPQKSGMEVLAQVKETKPSVPVVMVTAFGTVETAVSALKAGAFDYVTKPFEQAELLAVVEKAVNTYYLSSLEPQQHSAVAGQHLNQWMHVGLSLEMQEVEKKILKIAATPTTVLITGESGTGKEMVATAIFRLSDRSNKPFVKINCAAIPQNLIEAELFGYEKGAFTGAVNSKPGRFELAHEGTLFLDEVGEMPLDMQVKLLRVIQESEFERVGGLNTIKVNVRLIAATNRDLQKEVREGRFREDLFYRLNVVPLKLPPLRDRKGDIEQLIYLFMKKFSEKLNKQVLSIDPLCLERLKKYYWPGNIRQLENVMEHSVLFSERGLIRLQDLPAELRDDITEGDVEVVPSAGTDLNSAVAALQSGQAYKEIVRQQTQTVERELIQSMLEECEGNVTRTAERLGLSRKGLQLKIKELGIQTRE